MIKFGKFLQEQPVWEKPSPVKKHSKLSPGQKAKAKARAKAAGRPYPNMVDNIWAARTEEKITEARTSRRVPPGQRLLKHIADFERRTKPKSAVTVVPKKEDPQVKMGEVRAKSNVTEKFDLPRLGSNPGKFKRLVTKHLGAKAAEKISAGDGAKIMAKAKKSGNTNLFRQGSFIRNFYKEENLSEMDNRTPSGDRRELRYYNPEEEAKRKEKFKKDLKKLSPNLRKKLRLPEQKEDVKEEKSLGKPHRTPGGPKKFSVYVRNEKGNVVKVNFGDPNLSIKRDNPKRRKSFRARHHCENPGPRTKARYWSCRQWRAGAKVEA